MGITVSGLLIPTPWLAVAAPLATTAVAAPAAASFCFHPTCIVTSVCVIHPIETTSPRCRISLPCLTTSPRDEGSHAPVALGLAQRALQEIAGIVNNKIRPGYEGSVGDSDLFQLDFMRHEAKFRAAQAYVYEVFGDAEATAAQGIEISDEQRARMRAVTTPLSSAVSLRPSRIRTRSR